MTRPGWNSGIIGEFYQEMDKHLSFDRVGMNMDWNFSTWIEEKRLLFVTVVQPKKARRTVVGRLLQVDTQQRNLLLYDDDQKNILHLNFNEIDDIQPM